MVLNYSIAISLIESEYCKRFLWCSYLSVIDIQCPWILRYLAVIAMNQGRQGRVGLTRVADIIERSDVKVADPILLFVYHLIVHMDFMSASQQLSRLEDVFASDFFLASRGVEYESVCVRKKC